MFKHAVIDLFKSFSRDEIDRFNKFLSSPYFNGSKKIIKLYKEIVKYYPLFDNVSLNKKNLCLKTSQSGTYNESTLRDALSILLKLTQKFLLTENLEKNEADSMNILLSELMKRNQEKLFNKTIKILESKAADRHKEDSSYFYNLYFQDVIKFNFKTMNNKVLHKAEALDRINSLTETSISLIKFFIMEIISLALNLTAFGNKYNMEYKTNLVYMIFDKLNIIGFLDYVKGKKETNIINIYKALLEMYLCLDKDMLYKEYKILLFKYFDKLSINEISFHLHCSINYCILKKKNYPSYEYEKELFELYELLLNNRYFEDAKTKYITVDLYRDILLHGLNLKKYLWVDEFIVKYNHDLPPKERQNIMNYSYTHYYFSIGNYYKALEHYSKIVMDSFVYKYDIKNLALKLYYELKYYEEALDEIHSYKEFLRNNPMVTIEKRKRIGNFLMFTEKLIHLEMGSSKIDGDYIFHKLNDENNVSFKKWLLEKSRSVVNILK